MTPSPRLTPDELATHPSFVGWVLQTDPDAMAYWENWLNQYPDQAATVWQARALVLAARQQFGDSLPAETVRLDLRRLRDELETPAKPTAKPTPVVPLRRRWWLPAAASLLLLLGLGWYLRSGTTGEDPGTLAGGNGTTLETTNETDRPRTVVLADGSTARLEPGSILTYSAAFSGTERVVQLSGEAFFDVVKNPAQPFLVYTRYSVTRVLGTSFRVRAFRRDAVTQVLVRTGRVMVYRKTDFEPTNSPTPGVELLPRQQVTLDETGVAPKKEAVANPTLLAPPPGTSEVSYDNQPVSDVLRNLSRTYQVPIDFDPAALASCRITTTFVDEALAERLTSIGIAIGAKVEVVEGRFVVRSRGCQPDALP
jgi:ferric-dicitrate binding protein FerR (iron transport regulator)